MMDEMPRISYDQVPYPALSFSQSHPDSLAIMATLLGMSPAPVERCRMLELGCAVGGNLVPMAYALPDSKFVGIDSSASQIAEGNAMLAALELRNVTLRHLDILDVDPSLGQFDYIIAHGVYSWVPETVQDKILQICKKNLAPNGVCYVSYNTYPGWHMINIIRGLMLYHTRDVADPQVRAEKAREALQVLAECCPGENNAYCSFLRMYAEFLEGKLDEARPRSDSLLLHDEMEDINEPVYFYQFAERAAGHGLQYLADLHHTGGGGLSPETSKTLQSLAKTQIDLEQYLDFVQNRTFRQTLLCHQGVEIDRNVGPDRVLGFYFSSRAVPEEADADIHQVSVLKFRGHDDAILSTDHPVTKAAMLHLAQIWPRALSFGELLSAARLRLQLRSAPESSADDIDAQVLAANLLTAYSYSKSLVRLHVYAPEIELKIGDRPVASAVARVQAQDSETVTNLRHDRVRVDGLDRYLLRHLDGSRDREALVDLLLAGPVAQGILSVRDPDDSAKDMRSLLVEELEKRLAWLTRAALFVHPST